MSIRAKRAERRAARNLKRRQHLQELNGTLGARLKEKGMGDQIYHPSPLVAEGIKACLRISDVIAAGGKTISPDQVKVV